MSTITTINWTDNIKDSRAVINNNFTNLNNDKVEKVTWKGLSTNDFSNTDKAKLDWLSNYTLPTASDSVLWWVKVDWTTITIIDWVISSSGGGGGSWDMTKAVYDPANWNKQVAFKDEVVPYTWATSDVDLDTNKLSAVSLQIKGTWWAWHLALKHQSAWITASTNESSLWANNSWNPIWKNDWNTQQNIMLENTAITWATKTKITYDSKWLVTNWADATTVDIADSTNKRYVTDSQLTVIGNTSNTNSWDETKASIESKLTWTITSHNHSWVYQPLATVLTNTTASYTTTIDTRLANTSWTNTWDNAVNSLYSWLATSKQDTLVSWTNIKTVNWTSLLGSWNIVISGWSWATKRILTVWWTIWATWTNVWPNLTIDWTYTVSQVNLSYWTAWNWTLTVDINKNWTTLFDTIKPSITWTNKYSINTWTLTDTSLVAWDSITIDIDAVPWTPWTDLYIEIIYS